MMKGYCVHFSGTISDICDLGFNYIQVARKQTQEEIDWHNENFPDHPLERSGISKRMPCATRNEVSCPDYQEPTQEDLSSQEEEIASFLQRVDATRKVIIRYIDSEGQKGHDFIGNIPCPICNNGTVEFTYAGSYNGHIHARCNTSECVQWME